MSYKDQMKQFPVGQWLPIEMLDGVTETGVIALKAKVTMEGVGRQYVTDTWSGFRKTGNAANHTDRANHGFARWPHPFPPTHFLVYPEF
jgi:hypothetical protein